MNWQPSDRFIQVTAGVLLLTVSSFFLWQDTIKPISKGLRKEGILSTNLQQGMRYLTGKEPEDEVAKEKEKLRLEEQKLQQKLEELRKKRDALHHERDAPHTAPLPEHGGTPPPPEKGTSQKSNPQSVPAGDNPH